MESETAREKQVAIERAQIEALEQRRREAAEALAAAVCAREARHRRAALKVDERAERVSMSAEAEAIEVRAWLGGPGSTARGVRE